MFADKVVVITGGSRGLGLVLARERCTIDSGSLVQLLPADVTDAAQVERAFSTMLRRFGRIDVVINNAGQILSAPFHDTTPIPEGRARFATQGRHLQLPAAVRGATALNERAADRNNQR